MTAVDNDTSAVAPKLLMVANDFGAMVLHREPVIYRFSKRALVRVVSGGEIKPFDLGKQVSVVRLPINRYRLAPVDDLRIMIALWRMLGTYKPDIVYALTAKPNLFSGLVVAMRRLIIAHDTRLIMLCPGLGRIFSDVHWDKASPFKRAGYLLRRRVFSLLMRTAIRLSRAEVIFENANDRDYWLEHGIIDDTPTHVVQGAGVNTDYFRAEERDIETGPMTVCFAGRLLRAKGINTLIDVAFACQRAGDDVRFLLAGDFDRKDKDHFDPSKVDLPANMKWLGPLDDVRPLLQMSDVVCLPTFYAEGIPRILLEGAAMECALLATDHPGCRLLIDDGETGYAFSGKNLEVFRDELLAAVRDMSRNRARTLQMGRNARKLLIARKFDEAAVLNQYENIFFGLSHD